MRARNIMHKTRFSGSFLWLSIICFYIIASLLPLNVCASPESQSLVSEGREMLFNNGMPTYSSIILANKKFEQALGADGTDQEANFFYAISQILAFAIQTEEGQDIDTLAELFESSGMRRTSFEYIESGPPFMEPPQIAGYTLLPDTTPDGETVRNLLSAVFVNILSDSLDCLSKTDETFNLMLTEEELADQPVEVDYGDVLLLKSVLSFIKTIFLILGSYNLDVDIREFVSHFNAEIFELQRDLLDSYANVLQLISSDGPQSLISAKTSLLEGISFFDACLDFIENEQDYQGNDFFYFGEEEDLRDARAFLAKLDEMRVSLNENRPADLLFNEEHWIFTNSAQDMIEVEIIRDLEGNFIQGYFWGLNSCDFISCGGKIDSCYQDGNVLNISAVSWGSNPSTATLSGVITNGQITGGNYIVIGSSGNETTGQFTGILKEKDNMLIDLNHLFGNEGKAPLNIRGVLPEFDKYNEMIPGTFPPTDDSSPVLNSMFPDLQTNADIEEDMDYLPPGTYIVPEASIEIDGNFADWASVQPAFIDMEGDEKESDFPGMDLKDIYVAMDEEYYYFRFTFYDGIGAYYQGGQTGYAHACYNFKACSSPHGNPSGDRFCGPCIGPENEIFVHVLETTHIPSQPKSLGISYSGYAALSEDSMEWKVHREDMGSLNGKYIVAWTHMCTEPQIYRVSDYNHTKIQLNSTFVAGTVSCSAYTSGNIFIYAYDGKDPETAKLLGKTVASEDKTFIVFGIPIGSNVYIKGLYDKDINGFESPGDYTGDSGPYSPGADGYEGIDLNIENEISLDDVIQKGTQWLIENQKPDGSWEELYITELAALALLNNGYNVTNPAIEAALSNILDKIEPGGAISEKTLWGPPGGMDNITTSFGIIVLTSADRYNNPERFGNEILNAVNYMLGVQNTEANISGLDSSHPAYGGWNYIESCLETENVWSNLFVTQITLSALRIAKDSIAESTETMTKIDEAVKKGLVFIQRCQNRPSSNDQYWAHNRESEYYNDGGFINNHGLMNYPPADIQPYNIMTYRGILGYLASGIKADDPRIADACNWSKYNFNSNFLIEPSLYNTYYHMAKALVMLGKTADIIYPEWFKPVSYDLMLRQQSDGSWINSNPQKGEGDKAVATSYALLALAAGRAPSTASLEITITGNNALTVTAPNNSKTIGNPNISFQQGTLPGGTYLIDIEGVENGTYTLTISANDRTSEIYVEPLTRDISAGEKHRYELIVSSIAGFDIMLKDSRPKSTVPFIEIINPSVSDDEADDAYMITWIDADLDDNAIILIEGIYEEGIFEDGPNYYFWNPVLYTGDGLIKAEIKDNINTYTAYSTGTVLFLPDGMPRLWEEAHGLNIFLRDGWRDPDGDGLLNIDEYNNNTDPKDWDTDNDGLPDGWEVENQLDPKNDSGEWGMDGDPDEDGLPNIYELRYNSNPNQADSDGDGIIDSHEVYTYMTDPASADTDKDGLSDIEEINLWDGISYPRWDEDIDKDDIPNIIDEDSDNDGYLDGYEVYEGTDPSDHQSPSTYIPPPSTQDLVIEGRSLLFNNGSPAYSGFISANEKFGEALAADPMDQEANFFYAITRILVFALEHGNQPGLDTLRELFESFGMSRSYHESLGDGPPYTEPPNFGGYPDLPETTPSGEEIRVFLADHFAALLTDVIGNLNMITDAFSTTITTSETNESAVEVDYGDVLLIKSILSLLKFDILFITSYNLDIDTKELTCLINADIFRVQRDLLDKYQDLLSLVPEDGMESLILARISLLDGISFYEASLDFIEHEEDYQGNDLFYFGDKKGIRDAHTCLDFLIEIRDSLNENRASDFYNTIERWQFTIDDEFQAEASIKKDRNGNLIDGELYETSWGYRNFLGDVVSWTIIGNIVNIEISIEGYMSCYIEMRGIIDGWRIYEGTYTGICDGEEENGKFNGRLMDIDEDLALKIDLNSVFGNEGKSPLDIRSVLPQFDQFDEIVPGTFPPEDDSYPVLNNIFPDIRTNSDLTKLLELSLAGIYHIPMASIQIDGNFSDWELIQPAYTDICGDEEESEPDFPGMDLKDVYIAQDNDNYYLRLTFYDGLGTDYEDSYSPAYGFLGATLPFDHIAGDHFCFVNPDSLSLWIMETSWHPWFPYDLGISYEDGDFISKDTDTIEWRVPKEDMGSLNGKFIRVWTSMLGHYNRHIKGEYNDTKIQLNAGAASGTVTCSAYTSGKIFIYAYDGPDPDSSNLIGSTTANQDKTFSIGNIPLDTEIYLIALWDHDENGVKSWHDYSGWGGPYILQKDVSADIILDINQHVNLAGVIEKGIQWLVNNQNPDGSWSNDQYITQMAALCLMNYGYNIDDPEVASSIDFIINQMNQSISLLENGTGTSSIYTYQTETSMLASYVLVLSTADKYNATRLYIDEITNAVKYLLSIQYTEGNIANFDSSHPEYGGWSYGAPNPSGGYVSSDLSNTQFCTSALNEAMDMVDTNTVSLADIEKAMENALIFIQRCQHRATTNDQPWAHNRMEWCFDGGGFVSNPNVGFWPWFSDFNTYAGISAYLNCGLNASDPRITDACLWAHYESNPGNISDYGLYNTCYLMSKSLAMMGGISDIVNPDWFQLMTDSLMLRQKWNGSWINYTGPKGESNPALSTSLALLSLETLNINPYSALEIDLTGEGILSVKMPGGEQTTPGTHLSFQPGEIIGGSYLININGGTGGSYTLTINAFDRGNITTIGPLEREIILNEVQRYELVSATITGLDIKLMDTTPESTIPFITINNPAKLLEKADDVYLITWEDRDIDDNAVIHIFYDDDNNSANGYAGEITPPEGIDEDGDDADYLLWDISNLPEGAIYYIYATITDSTNTASAYSTGSIIHTPDSMPIEWEIEHSLNIFMSDDVFDIDNDGLSNIQEFDNNTNPRNADSDNDNLSDGDEIYEYQTDPLNPDSDADTVKDGQDNCPNIPNTDQADNDPISSIRIRAYIDGISELIFKENGLQWYHMDFAAPGRLDGTDEPTYINDHAWYPWPLPGEYRDCYCYSEVFEGIPFKFHDNMNIYIENISVRESVDIIQYPAEYNDYILIIEFNDYWHDGADWYEIELYIWDQGGPGNLITGDGIGDICDNCPSAYNPDQNDTDQDSLGDACDNCPSVFNPDQQDSDDDEMGNVCDNCLSVFNPDQQDLDQDSLGDACDNCPSVFNPEQQDTDDDEIGNVCDNCPSVFNPDQQESDDDGIGDSCDNCPSVFNPDQNDPDQDSLGDACDNCPSVFNPEQQDIDDDEIGNMCDNCLSAYNPDQQNSDQDSLGDACDNCPSVFNPDQQDSDNDEIGNACDNCLSVFNPDQQNSDQDSLGNTCDNCPSVYNPDQQDSDDDEIGNACDNCPSVFNPDQQDSDDDGVGNVCDNCPSIFNPDQQNSDQDSLGNACDNCPSVLNPDQQDSDDDEIGNACDNCPSVFNPDQQDSDDDEIGNACDNCPSVYNPDQQNSDQDSLGNACDNCPSIHNSEQSDTDNDGVGNLCDQCLSTSPDTIVDPNGCAIPPPPPPEELTGSQVGFYVHLSWNEVPEVSGYYIYRDGRRINKTLLTYTSFDDLLISGKTIIYNVTAVNNEGVESEFSNNFLITTKPSAPVITRPYNLEIFIGSPIKVQGQAEPGSTIDVFVDGISQGTTLAGSWGSFGLSGINLSEGENTITANSTNIYGTSSLTSNPVIVTLDSRPIPPSGLKATPDDTVVTITWNPNTESDLQGYNIYRDGDRLNYNLLVETTFIDTRLTNGRVYKYTVTAVDNIGSESNMSSSINVAPIAGDEWGIL